MSRPLIRLTSTSQNSTAAICRTVAPVTAPVAAVTAATAGSSTLAKEVIPEMASRPRPSREFTSVTATAVTARVPASAAAGISCRLSPRWRLSATPHTSSTSRISTPDRTARRTTPAISRLPVSRICSRPSSRPVP